MARNFIDGNEIRLTVKDKIFCDVEFYTGQKLSDLEPRRLFPVSGLNDYITFLDSEGEEQFILRRLDNMEPHQRELLQGCLEEYYRIPKIKQAHNIQREALHMALDCGDRPRRIHLRDSQPYPLAQDVL